jgi:hypothetical protein
VQEAALVGMVHGAGHFGQQAHGGALIVGQAGQVLGQAAAIEELEAEEGLAVVHKMEEWSKCLSMLPTWPPPKMAAATRLE